MSAWCKQDAAGDSCARIHEQRADMGFVSGVLVYELGFHVCRLLCCARHV